MNIIPLTKEIKRKEFDCGNEELNKYLRQFAIPNDKKRIGKTFVAIEESEPLKPIGYYTVSTAQILFKDLPEESQKGLPRYPIPAMRIGKLAVDINNQGKQIGAFLLKDALLRALKVSTEVALNFIIVDALNEKAKSFYLKYGFIPLGDNSLALIISLKTVEKAVTSE